MTAGGHYDEQHAAMPNGTICYECGELAAEEGNLQEPLLSVMNSVARSDAIRDWFTLFIATRTVKSRILALDMNRCKERLVSDG